MIDYDFYVNTYLGSAIPEKAFPAAVTRAAESLQKIKRQYQVVPTDGVSEQMALCAMAETVYRFSTVKPGVTAATVGGVSVRYDNRSGNLGRQLLESAQIYLDIYRGAEKWTAR